MKPPIHAPAIAGAPAITASAAARPKLIVTPRAAGAAMPIPSVTLWIMNPTIRNVPSVSSPNANDDPIASPSPRLWTPIPIATSIARERPPIAPPEPRAENRRETRTSPRYVAASPSSTSPVPPSGLGSDCCSSRASASASTARNVSRPAVSAMNAESHCFDMRRSDGSHARPSATGTMPTRKPMMP